MCSVDSETSLSWEKSFQWARDWDARLKRTWEYIGGGLVNIEVIDSLYWIREKTDRLVSRGKEKFKHFWKSACGGGLNENGLLGL